MTLTVTVMDLTQDWYDHEECPYYRVEVRDGDDAEAPLMGIYCGSRAPPHLTTQGSAMFVQVMSLLGGPVGTFTAMYSVLSSGKLHHSVKGNICPMFCRIVCCHENCFCVQKKQTLCKSHTHTP